MLGGLNTFECGNCLVVIYIEADKELSQSSLSQGSFPLVLGKWMISSLHKSIARRHCFLNAHHTSASGSLPQALHFINVRGSRRFNLYYFMYHLQASCNILSIITVILTSNAANICCMSVLYSVCYRVLRSPSIKILYFYWYNFT